MLQVTTFFRSVIEQWIPTNTIEKITSCQIAQLYDWDKNKSKTSRYPQREPSTADWYCRWLRELAELNVDTSTAVLFVLVERGFVKCTAIQSVALYRIVSRLWSYPQGVPKASTFILSLLNYHTSFMIEIDSLALSVSLKIIMKTNHGFSSEGDKLHSLP